MAKAITLDGPAGAGKSTTAKRLSQKTGLGHLNTGLFYRSIALGFRFERGVSALDVSETFLAKWAQETRERFRLIGGTMLLDGEDITSQCRAPHISQEASGVSRIEAMRAHVDTLTVASIQQDPDTYVLTDGRDEARLHRRAGNFALGFYLTAPVEVRAYRQYLENGDTWLGTHDIMLEMMERDMRDASREESPLSPLFDYDFCFVRSLEDVPLETIGMQLGIDTHVFEGEEDRQDELMLEAISRIDSSGQ